MINGSVFNRGFAVIGGCLAIALSIACEPPETDADLSAAMLGILATQGSAGAAGSGGPESTVDFPGAGEAGPGAGPEPFAGFALISTYEENILPDAKIPLRFSEDLDPGTLTMQPTTGECIGTVQISSDDFRTCLGGTIEYVAHDRYRLILAEKLPEGTTYRLRLQRDIRSQAGFALAGSVERNLRTCASAWREPVHYRLEDGRDAQANGVAAHDGTIYAAGWAYGNHNGRDQQHWVVLKSDDDGQSYSPIDIWPGHVERGTQRAYAMDIAVAPDGTIYVVGVHVGLDGLDRFSVRYSQDGGRTWRFWWRRDSGGSVATAVDVRDDGLAVIGGHTVDRNLYCGSLRCPNATYFWSFRAGKDKERLSTLLKAADPDSVESYDIEVVDGQTSVVHLAAAINYEFDRVENGILFWHRQRDGHRNFHQNFQYNGRNPADVDLRAVYFDGVDYFVAGTVYVDGYYEWMVSRFDTLSENWAYNRDRFRRLDGRLLDFYPKGIADDANGVMYVAGYSIVWDTKYREWLIRYSRDGGETFQTLTEDNPTEGIIWGLSENGPGRMVFVGDHRLPGGRREMAMREYGCR